MRGRGNWEFRRRRVADFQNMMIWKHLARSALERGRDSSAHLTRRAGKSRASLLAGNRE